jgi:hypothetical protein
MQILMVDANDRGVIDPEPLRTQWVVPMRQMLAKHCG